MIQVLWAFPYVLQTQPLQSQVSPEKPQGSRALNRLSLGPRTRLSSLPCWGCRYQRCRGLGNSLGLVMPASRARVLPAASSILLLAASCCKPQGCHFWPLLPFQMDATGKGPLEFRTTIHMAGLPASSLFACLLGCTSSWPWGLEALGGGAESDAIPSCWGRDSDAQGSELQLLQCMQNIQALARQLLAGGGTENRSRCIKLSAHILACYRGCQPCSNAQHCTGADCVPSTGEEASDLV